MRKNIFGLLLMLFTSTIICSAQNGLESIVVEKFYVSNAADSIASAASGAWGTLPVGSVTYRIYADMLPGYNFQALYGEQTGTGVPLHILKIQTSTSFFNNEDRGALEPSGITPANMRKNTVLLDSWFTVGAAAQGEVGVLKSEDTDGSPGNAQSLLQNNDPSTNGPVNIGNSLNNSAKDGMIPGTPAGLTFVGINAADLSLFNATSQVGNLFTSSNGSVAALGGAVGPTAANRLLVGQFTTNGIFHFELNVQIGTPSGGTEHYVAFNPATGEISIPSLVQTFGATNVPPTIGISSPLNGDTYITNATVGITALANDTDGTVDSVAFYIDGNFLSSDHVAPYTASYTATLGSHCITATATDNKGAQTTTACVNITVSSNTPPTVNITSPANLSSAKINVLLNINATATDNTNVDSVAFYYDGIYIGKDLTSLYSMNYLPSSLGTHTILVRATDDQGASNTVSVVINVVNNTAPTVSLTAPSNGAVYTFPAVVTINANATDNDGTVDSVEFLVNGVKVGSDNSSPYSFSWNSVIGSANLSVRATDNNGTSTTSAIRSITIADPNALPYRVVSVNNSCGNSSFCLPVAAVDSVKNVIGYDLVLQYNKTKVAPTGIITVDNAMITPSFVTVSSAVDTGNGKINISMSFNSTAPANTNFNGKGNLICIQFNKLSGFGSVDTANFTILNLQESYYTGVVSKLSDAGKIISYRDSLFNGSLKNWIDNSAIKYNSSNPGEYLITNIYGNDVNCTSIGSSAVQPDTIGNFQQTITNGSSISIVKDILGTTDVQAVINGFDAMLANKVLLNDASFIPNIYQAISMDVNMDGVISAGDVSQINQRAVLMIPEFKQAWNYNAQGVSNGQLSYDWLFIDSITLATNPSYLISTTYPLNDGTGFSKAKVPAVPSCLPITAVLSDCPVIAPESFKGILIGDVNGNYSTAVPNGMFRQDNEKIIFDLSKTISSNGYIDIPVHINSAEIINSLDFSLNFNESIIKYISVIDPANNLQALTNYNAFDKTFRFTSNSLQNYNLDGIIVYLRLTTDNSTITKSDLNNLKGYLNGEEADVELKVQNNDLTNDVAINVYPNPAKTVLNIAVSEDASFNLISMDGKKAIPDTKINANQTQVINTSILADGIYLMKIYNDKFVSIKKVAIRN